MTIPGCYSVQFYNPHIGTNGAGRSPWCIAPPRQPHYNSHQNIQHQQQKATTQSQRFVKSHLIKNILFLVSSCIDFKLRIKHQLGILSWKLIWKQYFVTWLLFLLKMLFSLSYFYWEHKLSSELADMRTGGTGGTDSLPMTLEIFTTNNLKIIRSLKDSHIISTRSD